MTFSAHLLMGDFGAVFGTALKERNRTIGYKKYVGISAYRKAFLLFWQLIFKEKTKETWSWLFLTTWFSWILNFIIKFYNAFTSTLAILAALDSNLVANLGLRKYSPSFVCTTAACKSKLSRVGVWRCTAVVGGYHSWTTKGVTDLKHWNVKILKHEKSGKLISIQVDL